MGEIHVYLLNIKVIIAAAALISRIKDDDNNVSVDTVN